LKGEAAVGVGAVEFPIAERKRLASLSRSWTCPDCGVPNIELLPDPPAKGESAGASTDAQSAGEAAEAEVVAVEPHPTALDAPPTPASPIIVAPTPVSLSTHSSTPLSPIPSTPVTAPPTPMLHPQPAMIKSRPPLWLDASIVVFSFLVVYLAGKRLTNLWDFVSEYV